MELTLSMVQWIRKIRGGIRMSDKVRVRYAPSPTGHLHIGNARTAVFNYLFARHHKGEFIIRIEDTDTKRNIADGEKSQLNNLKWLGVDWDEGPDKPGEFGPYRQSERNEIYLKYIDQLLESGDAYYAYDTSEEIEAEHQAQINRGEAPRYVGKWRNATEAEREQAREEGRPQSIRLRVPADGVYRFDDMVKGDIQFEAKDISGDFVILKQDGQPTYNFAVAVDDHLMDITHVLRGDDHIANTPKQMMVYEALGWEPPIFGHMTLITNAATGKKLSKRDESILQFIEQYRDLGYLPEAMFNFITLLGWSPKGEEEMFSRDEFIKIFDTDRLSKSPAAFDNKKLEWINNRYMKATDAECVAELAIDHLRRADRLADDANEEEMTWTKKLVSLYKDEMSYAAQIVPLSEMFFQEELTIAPEAEEILTGENVKTVLVAFREKLSVIDTVDFTEENIMAAIKQVQKETGIKGKNLYMPIRVATSGEQHGPSIGLTIEVLGNKKSLHHLDQAIAKLA